MRNPQVNHCTTEDCLVRPCIYMVPQDYIDEYFRQPTKLAKEFEQEKVGFSFQEIYC